VEPDGAVNDVSFNPRDPEVRLTGLSKSKIGLTGLFQSKIGLPGSSAAQQFILFSFFVSWRISTK
jgi:hypothetical protein